MNKLQDVHLKVTIKSEALEEALNFLIKKSLPRYLKDKGIKKDK